MTDRVKPRPRIDLIAGSHGDGEHYDEDTALSSQIGGDHYKGMKIQPMEYSMANKLDPCQHTIIKYVSRFRSKNGLEDLIKAKHCIDLLIQLEGYDRESDV